MPVVSTTAYSAASEVLSLVRSLLNDAAGNLFTDAVLIPYLNSGYRKVQRALAMTGQTTFIEDNATLIVAKVATADPSVQVVITEATAPPNSLPSNLLHPLRLWERASGSSDQFSDMTDMTSKGGLPSRLQSQSLGVWEWRNDGLYFVGATQDVQVRIRYAKAYPNLVDSTSTILIRNAQEVLAFFTAALAAMARGSPLADKWDAAATDALENLVAASIRQQQYTPRRRRPYSWRSGYGPLI